MIYGLILLIIVKYLHPIAARGAVGPSVSGWAALGSPLWGLPNKDLPMRQTLAFSCLLFLACGAPQVDPEISSCRNACATENSCPGAKQQNCNSLCDARPSKCMPEYADYWTCAEAHPTEACSSYQSCTSAFARYSNCVLAFCFAYPLDAACFYSK